jgi:hypothetical protein
VNSSQFTGSDMTQATTSLDPKTISPGPQLNKVGHVWPGSNDFRSFMKPLIREAMDEPSVLSGSARVILQDSAAT